METTFYQNHRLDKDTLQLFSPWDNYSGSPVIYARGNQVFTQNEVWDRDSYTNQYLLLNTYKQIITLPNGIVIMVSNDGKLIQKFDSLQAIHDSSPNFNSPSLQIANFYFNDSDPKAKEISGLMSWYSTPGYSIINSYTVYFLDQNQNKIGSKIAEITYDPAASAYYSYNLPATAIPEGAKYLGIFTKNTNGESSSAATVEIMDQGEGSNNGGEIPSTGGGSGSSGGGFFEYTIEDQNPIRGQIHPLVSWTSSLESNYSGYKLAITNEAGGELSSANFQKHSSPGTKYKLFDVFIMKKLQK